MCGFVKRGCFYVGERLVHCKTHLPSPSFALMNERTAAGTSSLSFGRVRAHRLSRYFGRASQMAHAPSKAASGCVPRPGKLRSRAMLGVVATGDGDKAGGASVNGLRGHLA
jgi:hypothetical protein